MKRRSLKVLLVAIAIAVLTVGLMACSPTKYTLSFETNGGGTIPSITAEAGTDISDKLPASPKKDGYVFAGWFDNADLSGAAVELPTTMPSKNVKYYAKWTEGEMAILTLNLAEAGGENKTIQVPVGAVISEYTKGIEPEAEGLTFGNWFYGSGEELGATDTMPSGGLTLNARFKASVTVKVYRQGLDGEYGTPETKTTMEWYNSTMSAVELGGDEHFHAAEGKPTTFTVGKGENNFEIWLERNKYTVKFNSNLPADCVGSEGETDDIVAFYEQEIELPDSGCEAAIYMFSAWGTQPSGGDRYEVAAKFKVEDDTEFYAIWDKGYIDRFGGYDIVYVLSGKNQGKVIMSRPGVGDIEGSISGEEFTVTKGDVTLKGKISADGRFVYYREAQKGTYKLYEPYDGTILEATLELDGYDKATYTDEDGAVNGTYSADYDPETGEFTGMYRFVTADNVGFYFMMQEVASEKGTETVFLIRSQYAGVYYRFVLSGADGMGLLYQTYLILDGYGSAMIAGYDEDGEFDVSAAGTYKIEAGTSVVEAKLSLDTTTYSTYHYKLVSVSNLAVYIECNEELKGTFKSDKDTLVLDGFGDSEESAVYTSGGTTKKGIYVYEEYPGSGNKIVRMATATEIITFRLDGDSFTKVGNGDYGEYYRYTSDKTATQPYIILDGSGKMTLYSNDNTGSLVEIAKGTYTHSGEIYTADLELTDDDYKEFDQYLNMQFKLRSEVFSNGSEQRTLTLYTIVNENGDKTYENKNGKLVLDEYGYGKYTVRRKTYEGKYFISERDEIGNILEFAVFDEYGDVTDRFYFLLDDKNMSFTLLNDEIGAYTICVGGSIANADEVLFLSGDGRALLYSISEDGTMSVKCDGEYKMSGDVMGEFTSESGEGFKFMLAYLGEDAIYTKFDEERSGKYTNGKNTLKLDGYEFSATYTQDGEGSENGYYYFDGELVVFIVSDSDGNVTIVRYFELGDGKTFTERGFEWGEYAGWTLNGGLTYEILKLDGHKGAELYQVDSSGESETLVAKGTYEFIDEYTGECNFTLKSVEGNKDVSFKAMLATYDSEPIFIKYDGNGSMFVGGMTVLDLDGYGNAAYLDVYGSIYYGTYSILGETIVDFTHDELGEMFFKLDVDKNTFSTITDGYVSENGILYKYLGDETDIKIPDGITEIGAVAFSTFSAGRYTGKDIKTLDLNGVKKVGDNAFRCCYELTSVVGKSVTELGYGAFESCIELVDLTLPELVTVGQMAFYGCDSIEEVKFEKVQRICAGAFSYMAVLSKAEFPIVEVVEAAAFYDCPMLTEVNLGSKIKEIQDEVFEAAETGCPLLVVIIDNKEVINIGLNEFTFRDDYIIKVPDIDTVFDYGADEKWLAYGAHVACRTEDDGTFYSEYLNRVSLHGLFYMYGSLYGVYDIENGQDGVKNVKIWSYYSGKFYNDYNGTISDDVLTIDDTAYSVIGGKQYSLKDKDNKELTFTMGKDTTWETEATYGDKKVSVQYIGSTLYLIEDNYRRNIEPDFKEMSFYLSYSEFLPIVELYSAEDKSWIYISQNNEDKTDYSVTSALFAGIKDESGNYLYITDRFPIEVKGDETSKEFKFSQLFGSANYTIAVTFNENDKTFTYTVEKLSRVELTDGNKSIVVWLNAEKKVTDIEFYIGGTEMNRIDREDTDDGYTVTVLDNGYEAQYNVWINKLFTLCTIKQNGKSGAGFVSSVARVVVFEIDGKTEFKFFVYDEYGYEVEVEDEVKSEKKEGGYYELTVNDELYYVTIISNDDNDDLEVLLVKAEMVYESSYNGDKLTLKYDKDGNLTSATLKLESGETLSNGTIYIDQYGYTYYRFVNGNTVYSVECYNNSMSIDLSMYTKHTANGGDIVVTYTMDDDYDRFDAVIGVTIDGVEKEFTFERRDTGVLIKVENDYYLLDTDYKSVSKVETKTATTDDEKYEFTVMVSGDKVISVVGLKVKEGNEWVDKTVYDSYYNDMDEMIVQSELDSALHCEFTVKDGEVTVVVKDSD